VTHRKKQACTAGFCVTKHLLGLGDERIPRRQRLVSTADFKDLGGGKFPSRFALAREFQAGTHQMPVSLERRPRSISRREQNRSRPLHRFFLIPADRLLHIRPVPGVLGEREPPDESFGAKELLQVPTDEIGIAEHEQVPRQVLSATPDRIPVLLLDPRRHRAWIQPRVDAVDHGLAALLLFAVAAKRHRRDAAVYRPQGLSAQ
jgi:hypothetical protein